MSKEVEYETVRIPTWEKENKKLIEKIDIDIHKSIKEAKRFNQGKPQYSLMDLKAMEPMIRGLMFGAEKYGRDDWKNGMPLDKILDSMLRHLSSILDGEEYDEESGLPHIGHLMCNAMFYSHFFIKNRKEKELKK